MTSPMMNHTRITLTTAERHERDTDPTISNRVFRFQGKGILQKRRISHVQFSLDWVSALENNHNTYN